ncbi:hypothetical protein MKO06_13435 [Gramella sp. GC03-9]|uniref:Uncharacterized protein n=1 Tax=Christiangramia oceanisediminis TaxID=2920386 RepID=A0A9X2KZ85_9FLAO|nr:hypothetical protein [Gramella oceanisediminis]MCP9200916.1 hypothetical protein [Gramella oceanisediminis]
MKKLILDSKAERVILLSGDRHISEFSAVQVDGLQYRLVDFTSSGLTHSYEQFTGEPNTKRIGEVVKEKSFGLLYFDFSEKTVQMEMRGVNNRLQQEYRLEFRP